LAGWVGLRRSFRILKPAAQPKPLQALFFVSQAKPVSQHQTNSNLGVGLSLTG